MIRRALSADYSPIEVRTVAACMLTALDGAGETR